MNLFQEEVLVLEASDKIRYHSSPILIDGDHGNCEFSELIPPGKYTLIMSMFALRRDIVIPPTPYWAVPLHVNILSGRISIFADVILRNEIAYEPQTTPLRLDPSNPPMVLSRVELEYPPDAKEAKISGIMKVEVVVNEEGEVYEAKFLSGYPLFQQAALNAALKWKFQPLILNGDLKPFVTAVTLDFHY
jgi:TonB family protein